MRARGVYTNRLFDIMVAKGLSEEAALLSVHVLPG
jgi:hypothetical protein